MSEANPVVFEISSDEEAGFDETNVRDDEDPDWLSTLLGIVDKERKAFDDDDDVVVVEEYEIKSKSMKVDDDDDDDCVVLDCDPEKVVDENESGGDGDDVVIVGQKGQIACRDYPHPRHDCAKFPFSSTPHETHCDLCHCYVCDLRAPCAFWGKGYSTDDHCHASNKNERWKTLRENLRLQKNGTIPDLVSPTPISSVVASQTSQMAQNEHVAYGAVPSEIYAALRNQAPQQNTIRACSSGGMATPNVMNQGINPESGFGQRSNGLLPCLVPGQITGVRPKVIRRDAVRNIGRPFFSSSRMFKKPGIIRGALATNQATQRSSNNINWASASQCVSNAGSLPTSMVQPPTGRPDVLAGQNLGLCASPGPTEARIGSSIAHPVLPQPQQVYSQPIPQSNDEGVYQSQNLVDSRFDMGFPWGNALGQSNQQTSVGNIPLDGLGNNSVPTPINDFSSDFTGNTQFDHCENWFSSHSMAQPGSLSAELNFFSPEPPAIDAGLLYFDYDASFNGLAQV